MPNLGDLQNANLLDCLGANCRLLCHKRNDPREKIGIGNFIVCGVSSQILFSLLIDNFGLLGVALDSCLRGWQILGWKVKI